MSLYYHEYFISVIVPVYNSQEFLRKCINSLVNQTLKNLEIILIDDGSTDNSGTICNEYADSDNRVRVIHKKNEGLVAARRTGIELAKGEYITFVDSDDYIDLDAYEIIANKVNDRKPDMVLFGLIEEYADHSKKKKNHIKEGWYNKEKVDSVVLPSMLSYGSFFDFGVLPNVVCKLIKKDLFEKSNFIVDDKITVGEDAAHTFQLIPFVSNMLFLDYYPYHYCKRNDSMMWREIEYDGISKLEKTLKESFVRAGVFQSLKKQLKEYISFVTLLKAPQKILDSVMPFCNQNVKIALYGAGGMGQAVYEKYRNNISVWVDKNYINYRGSFPQVQNIDLLKNIDEYDVIFIAILNTSICREISLTLKKMGINKNIYFYDGRSEQSLLNDF